VVSSCAACADIPGIPGICDAGAESGFCARALAGVSDVATSNAASVHREMIIYVA